ncbi:MAG: restriction endonuclease subunit S [Clostridia bacterium]|nr:restriction endonuclease subunit S [Clostridia bacterium]
MGSFLHFKTAGRGERQPKKIDASLNDKLNTVEWGEYKIDDLFDSESGDIDIQKKHINGKGEWVITAGVQNYGVLGKSNIKAKTFKRNSFTIDMFGNVFYRQFDYKMVTHARVFSLNYKNIITPKQGLFIANCLFFLNKLYGYENMCSWVKICNLKIKLPIKHGQIDYDFMESFIAELEARRIAELEARRIAELETYLLTTGLKDYNLTADEIKALENFDLYNFQDYTFDEIFDNIHQGRRLKKEDQLPGNIPFVMAGVTNTGVVGNISNPVAMFPKNSITIDIFGNTFYRNYDFGAGDDTGVYWSEGKDYTQKTMLYFAAAMGKSLRNKFSYGKKLRSSQSLKFKMKLPTVNGKIDFESMETFISAIQKLVIKDVVIYADKKIEETKKVVEK